MFGRQDFIYNYTPSTESDSASAPAPRSLVFRLGFDHCAHENEYGMLLYYKRRLVKPYLKLGFQIQPRNQIRVVAIVEANHLAPTPNMQSFEEDHAYQDLIFALGQALKLFWTQYGSMASAYRTHCNDPMLKWVRCDVCARWRQLGPGLPHPSDTSCVKWTCDKNTGGTNVCNQPDDACRQQVPVRVLEKRPISPISPPKECRKRARSSTSPSDTPVKKLRHSAAGETNLMEIERGQHDNVLGTTSPIPNLQSPIGLDSCTPDMIASDGAELRTDPFSLNESDSPLSKSTSSPGNMLEKAAKAKPLPSTVRHENSELKALEAPVLPSMNAKHPDGNHVRLRGKKSVPKACEVEKGTSAAIDSLQEPLQSTQPSPTGHQGNKASIASTERPEVYGASQKRADNREKSSDEGELNHAVVSESRPRVRNAATNRLMRSDVARQGRPVSVPLVREVVVHRSAQFVDINNRNSTVKVYPETRQYIPDELLQTSTEGVAPAVSVQPPPYDNQPDANAPVALEGFGEECTVKVSNQGESNPQLLPTDRTETEAPGVPKGRNNEEEAIKLLLNLRTREYDGQPDVGKLSADTHPDQNYETKVVAELSGVTRAHNDDGAQAEDCRQTNRDIPDPFGDKSKPVTPAHNLLQTPTRTVQDVPQRGLPAHLASIPGMPSPNTANPFLDVTVEDVLDASPLNGIDISKDFLDLAEIDVGLKTPLQLKRIPRRTTPQNSASNMRKGLLHDPQNMSTEAVPVGALTALDPSNAQKKQSSGDRVVFDERNPQLQRNNCSIAEGPSIPNTGARDGQHVCCGQRIGAKQPSGGSSIRQCGRGMEAANEVRDGGSCDKVTCETLRFSDISSMIPWSQIAATAAAAGAVAAAAAARDAEKPSQPKTPERHSLDEGDKLRVSQEEVMKLRKELRDQKQLSDTFKEKFQELICELAPKVAGGVTKLLKNPNEIDVRQLSRDVLQSVTEKAREEAGMEQLQAIESCKASEEIACSSLERLRGMVRTFLEEAVGLTTQVEQDKPVDKHFEEYLNALDVFPP
ncbi:Morc S5 domain 2-like protein [Gracilaria domingensis]|nr:Morc S5 domain 2-like protein [Gracilaria domingensis]